MKKIIAALVFLAATMYSQVVTPGVSYVPTAPSGACFTYAQAEFVVPSGTLYTCQNGTWGILPGGVASSVSFSGITSGTNSTAAMVVNTGSSLVTTGTGVLDSTGVYVPETASTAGTTANLAVSFDGSTGNVSTIGLGGYGFLGFATTTATSGNPVQVCFTGTCTCIADNTVTTGNLLGAGKATAGRCRDLGYQSATSILETVGVWGKAQTGGAAGSTITINAPGAGHFGTSINDSMSTTPLSITGATPVYSFDSQGSGGLVVSLVSGGSITGILTWGTSGSGYAVGDLFTPGGGNNDAVIQITAVNGSNQPTAGTILYGGTGYISTGGYVGSAPTSSFAFTFLLSGALTQNVTFIMTNGTYQTQSNQWIWANNTTGAFTVTVCVAGATDACSGGRTVVIPQGTNNSPSVFVQTDGQLNVDLASTSVSGIATLSSGSVTVSNHNACTPSATCVYKLANCALNGSVAIGVPAIGTVVAGTSFVINSYTAIAGVAADSSKICWQIN